MINNTLPCSLFVEHIPYFKFLYLKLDFAHPIFSRCLIISSFFLDNQTIKHFTLKHWNYFAERRIIHLKVGVPFLLRHNYTLLG